MSEDRIGALDDAPAWIEFEAGDCRHCRQDRAAQRRDRIDSSERCCDFPGARAERPCSQPRLARGAVPELGHASERGSRPRAPPERDTLAKPDSQPVGMRPATQ